MDIYCQVCGEPWDYYGARHGGDLDKTEYLALIDGTGCPSCNGGASPPEETPFRAELTSALLSILGDDHDGVLAMLEDMEYIGEY